MKRTDLIRHLEQHVCEFHRQGGNHTIYVNRKARRSSSVPRHREVNDFCVAHLKELQRMAAASRAEPLTRDNFLARL